MSTTYFLACRKHGVRCDLATCYAGGDRPTEKLRFMAAFLAAHADCREPSGKADAGLVVRSEHDAEARFHDASEAQPEDPGLSALLDAHKPRFDESAFYAPGWNPED